MAHTMRHDKTHRARRRGFTLIELLLVLVILTALAAVVTPRFTQRAEQARITAARADIANLSTALSAFEIDTGRYPTTQEGLRALVERPSNVIAWHGPYIERGVPQDAWGNPLCLPATRHEQHAWVRLILVRSRRPGGRR